MDILQQQADALELEELQIDEQIKEIETECKSRTKALKDRLAVVKRVRKNTQKALDSLAEEDATTDISE